MLKRAFPARQGGFWWVPLAAAAVQAGAAYMSAQDRNRQAGDLSQQEYERQKEFAQNAIQWRTADAKRAGLHPLFALGGSGASYSPQAQVVGGGEEWDAVGTLAEGAEKAWQNWEAQNKKAQVSVPPAYPVARKTWDADGNEITVVDSLTEPELRVRNLGLEGDLIEQQKKESDQRMRESDFRMNNERHAGTGAVGAGAWEYRPDSVTAPDAGSPYLTAGTHPGFMRAHVPGVGEIIVPAGSSMSEAVESMESIPLLSLVIAANAAHYGPGGMERFYKAFPHLRGRVKDAVFTSNPSADTFAP